MGSEDGATDDTANASKADKGGRAQRTLPLPTDVVGLPRENTGNVGIARRGGEEDTEVTNTDVADIAQKSETWIMLAANMEWPAKKNNSPSKQRPALKRMKGDRICHLSP